MSGKWFKTLSELIIMEKRDYELMDRVAKPLDWKSKKGRV